MALPPKVTMIMSLIVSEFRCDGGHAQNLATQIYNHHPQMTANAIHTLLLQQFPQTGAGVLFAMNVSNDIVNVLNS